MLVMFCPTHNRYSCDFQMKVMVRPVTVKKVMESMLMSLPTAFGRFQSGMVLLPTYDPGPESGVVRLGATLTVLMYLPTNLEGPTKEI